MPPDADQHVIVRALVDELVRCGVRTAVTSPGSRSTPLVLALVRDGRLACHSLIDERCAGFFALGAAKATGMPAVLACTSGTAAANYLPAVVEAYEAGVPLLVLTADRPPELRDVGAGQAIDQIKLYGRAAKWFVEVGSHDATPQRLRWLRSLACRAVWTALDHRPGPVHLNLPLRDPLIPPDELPSDATGRADGAPRLCRSRRPGVPGNPGAPGAGGAIRTGHRPLIVAGRLERRPGAGDRGATTAALAQRLGVPLLADPLSGARRGSTAIAHYDALLRDETFAAGAAPDWVLRVGDLPTSKPLRRWLASLPEKVEQIALEPEGVWHDPDGVLARIVPAGEPIEAAQIETGWLKRWREADEAAHLALDTELRRRLSEPLVANHLATTLPTDAVLVVASSMPVRDVEAFAPVCRHPARVLANRGANGIDGTVATALGVAAVNDGPVMLLIGDVALLHDLGGLAALARARHTLTIVLVDNGGGGIFDALPVAAATDAFEEHVATPTGIDFAAASAMAGIAYHRVEAPQHLRPAFETTLLHVRTDRAESLALRRRCVAAVQAAIKPTAAATPPRRAGHEGWDPETYLAWMRREGVPGYDRLQGEAVAATRGDAVRSILELGTGTGETARRLLEAHPDATLLGVDANADMLAAARERLDPDRVRLELRRLEDPLPDGPFDLVASALAVHHLQGPEKADLFRRVRAVLAPGGRFVLADVIVPHDSDAAVAPLSDVDFPSTIADQLGWLQDAGFDATVAWEEGDLTVLVARVR
ncbi:MAG: 2-succinyl-5-enolpyruvyl-6-hydroxy-3-cyclohexene-1-carboxylic-acid synthase [Solirubrobacteraceae bacterium MAG38_C4-C5]|nr:2-succinyl-5-enolpyruvyl-6-hydroxy-3-cyclohexene-1-carboxylic-acid synthase [Candidatus Siliceabacter maunaloa]